MTTMLRVQTPCCGIAVRLSVIPAVTVERYDRICRECGAMWQVTRATIADDGSETIRRIDRLDWEEVV